jgi:hypothetical protein
MGKPDIFIGALGRKMGEGWAEWGAGCGIYFSSEETNHEFLLCMLVIS